MTYTKFLEFLVSAKNIQAQWESSIREEDRRDAATAVKDFIKRHGVLCSYINGETKKLECFFKFPSATSAALKNTTNLKNIHEFFFENSIKNVKYTF